MSFDIQVSDHTLGKTYHAGDTVSGILNLKGPITDPHLIITLYFHGAIRSAVTVGRGAMLDTATSFSRTLELFSGPLTLERGAQMNWPFG